MNKVKVEVLAGLPGKWVTVSKGKKQGTMVFNVLLKLFEEREVYNIAWQEMGKRSGGKAAVGGIAGGLIAGPLGILAGAAVGGKRKDTSTAVIETSKGAVLVRCNEKELKALNKILNSI